MQLTSFSLNRQVLLFKVKYTIISVIDEKTFVLCDDAGRQRQLSINTLLEHYSQGNLRGVRQRGDPETVQARVAIRIAGDIGEAARRIGQQRLAILRAIEHAGCTLQGNERRVKDVLEKVSKAQGLPRSPSISSIRRWQARCRFEADATALAPHFERKGGPGRRRMSPAVGRILDRAIDDYYLTAAQPSTPVAHNRFVADLEKENASRPSSEQLRIPSYSTFLRQLRQRSGYEVIAARNGAQEAEERYRSTGANPERYAFNECWEIDHTTLDLFVIDQQTGLTLGRPRLTVIIEFATRAVMGFDLDFSGASSQAALNTLNHAILPKNYLKAKYPEIRGEWPCFGLPSILKCDNGAEFHSASFTSACFDLGIELQYCPVKQPWFKARVERFFRTLTEDALRGLPGATGSHFYNRPKAKDPAKDATISLNLLQRYLHTWIVDVYMSKRHGGLL
jgi:putative transposase